MSRIRSNRGRAAALRSVWTWPLHSGTRLALTLAALAAVLLTHRALTAEPHDPPPPAPAPPAAAPVRPAPLPPATPPEFQGLLPPPRLPIVHTGPSADQMALRNAVGCAAAFVDHPDGIPPQRWRDRMRPYAHPELLARLDATDPATVPATRLIGAPQVLTADTALTTLIQPTDGVALRLTVIQPPGDVWRVSQIEPAHK